KGRAIVSEPVWLAAYWLIIVCEALIGALVMASLDNGMQQMNVDASWQMIVKGVVLVLAVWIDVLSGSNRG
ncbi:hypothetical protein ACQUWY_23915, partial [Ralstonia pseudosolanacearum]